MQQNTELITIFNKVHESNSEKVDSCRQQRKEVLKRMRADYVIYQASHPNKSNCVGTESENDASSSISTNTALSSNIIVVVPSIDLDPNEMKRVCSNIKYYEERQLYHLFLIVRDPSFRIIFLSSHPISEEVVRYYLTIDECNNDVLNERLSRLFLITTEELDHESLTLSENILKSDSIIQVIKSVVKLFSVGTKPTTGLSSYCGSNSMTQLEHILQLRLLETGETTLYLGSKQGRYVAFEFLFK